VNPGLCWEHLVGNVGEDPLRTRALWIQLEGTLSMTDLIRAVRRKAAKPYVCVRIPADRVIAATASPLPAFEAGRCYLEVRLAQMHLRDRREWWRGFLPLASVVTEFQSGTERPAAPFLVGASTLGDQLQGGPGYVELANKRVAGPAPYAGDQVRLFAALYRTEYENWADRALSLLETVAKQVDTTRLSSLVTFAPGIVAGLEELLGMQEVELRLGVDRELVPGDAEAGDNALRPGWFVMFGTGASPRPEQLSVQNDRLHWTDEREQTAEYQDSDFLLMHLRALDARDDYETFDFHSIQWARVQDRLWQYELDGAQASFGAFTSSLMQCADLTRDQRRNLWAHYEQMYREDLEQVRAVHERTAHLDSTTAPRSLSAAEVAQLALSPPSREAEADVDRLLAAYLD
jgi:hypothetical protein